eukprot:1145401-Pelagomonas_calceolata.AAC.5
MQHLRTPGLKGGLQKFDEDEECTQFLELKHYDSGTAPQYLRTTQKLSDSAHVRPATLKKLLVVKGMQREQDELFISQISNQVEEYEGTTACWYVPAHEPWRRTGRRGQRRPTLAAVLPGHAHSLQPCP